MRSLLHEEEVQATAEQYRAADKEARRQIKNSLVEESLRESETVLGVFDAIEKLAEVCRDWIDENDTSDLGARVYEVALEYMYEEARYRNSGQKAEDFYQATGDIDHFYSGGLAEKHPVTEARLEACELVEIDEALEQGAL
ncbi:hypothetical protein HMPREF9306_00228 [Propionimicrobium lymphophilum ACS-093-V-SCH5]|uniref:Uncharacterized protein n=1 Tax=Propionimicrobium lymphophilum ACS-093-V-SCH5 TaxID=883161 RepID=S2X1C1_9ACTN|nr:hypothetical protein [Propionimicrobium lymphophilum]EPD33814.1 hypothetical protein HMPREF9306_00228 [Propionimicrobium lymphophilum ACS-093-V-SCH5]